MKEYKRTSTQTKTFRGYGYGLRVTDRIQKKMNSELVIMQDDKIVRIKPVTISTISSMKALDRELFLLPLV